MERICFHLRVRQDRVEEYRARHKEVWPEMLEALRETGWRNYSLFLEESGLLTGYVECEDFDEARRAMAERAINQRWQEEMAGFFEDGSYADQQMRPLPEVFHLD